MRISLYDDQKAFEELFFDFYPSLCVFAQRYIYSSDFCEDIVQDTFFHIWSHRKKINITSSFRNFLITSVKNNCLDYLRKESVRNRVLNKNDILIDHETPDEIYSTTELEELIATVLQKMPKNIKKAFEMNRFENLTYNQIADRMKLSPKTIESYMSKALQLFREHLKEYI